VLVVSFMLYIACTHHTVMATCRNMFTNFVFVGVWVWKGRVAFILTDAPCLFYAETVLLPRLDFFMGLFIFFFFWAQGDETFNVHDREFCAQVNNHQGKISFFFSFSISFSSPSIISWCLLQLLNMLQGQIRSCVGWRRYVFWKKYKHVTAHVIVPCLLPQVY
jgi:hypothetical protein